MLTVKLSSSGKFQEINGVIDNDRELQVVADALGKQIKTCSASSNYSEDGKYFFLAACTTDLPDDVADFLFEVTVGSYVNVLVRLPEHSDSTKTTGAAAAESVRFPS